jgi:type II secretory pathway pseudopilin PulG
LIEVLIVVAIMAILAATLVPRLSSTADDAREAGLLHNWSVFKSQLQMYAADHSGLLPTLQDEGLPQMLRATDHRGRMGDSGPDYPLGPYFLESPVNPYDGSHRIVSVTTLGKRPTAVVGSKGGWQYDSSTGTVWPNHPEWYK